MSPENNQEIKEPEVEQMSAETPVATPEEQLAAVTAERDLLQNQLLRRQADFENFKRRADRDRTEFLQYVGMELARELLPIVDDFERAQKTDNADENYRKGIELIYQRLYDALKKTGLEPIESAGKPFDPNMHQAVARVETEEAADQTVLDEFQRGYNFKGKLLRPSMVRVAVKPG